MPTAANAPFTVLIKPTGDNAKLWKKIDALRSLNTTPKKGKDGKMVQSKAQGRTVLTALLSALIEEASEETLAALASEVDKDNQPFVSTIAEARKVAGRGKLKTEDMVEAAKHLTPEEKKQLLAALQG